MLGTVQLRGAKLVLAIDDTDETVLLKGNFLPGDRLLNYQLVERTPQTTLGVVKYNVNDDVMLHLPFYGSVCSYTAVVDAVEGFKNQGDRYVIRLEGAPSFNISVISVFGQSPSDDIPVLEAIYTEGDLKRPLPASSTAEKDDMHYTKRTVVDLTHLDTFTIDPTESQDFDDAISVDVEKNKIYIHIVDIANTDISTLEESQIVTFCHSLYLGEKTHHLLQEERATNELSLVPNQRRNTVTCEVNLNDSGVIVSYQIYRSVIVSKNRFTYDDVKGLLAEKSNKQICWLEELVHKRNNDANYNLNLPSIGFDKYGTPERHDTMDMSHQIVATAMILCNLVVSQHLNTSGVSIPNRFHDKLRATQNIRPGSITGHEDVDSFIICKKYAQATYSVDERGHFGLGLTDYVHFTSPMRRYADILIHRLLAGWTINEDDLNMECDWLNRRQWVVKKCHDQLCSWKVNRYIASQPPECVWDVFITDVRPAGVLWFLPELNIDGFCHVSLLEPRQRWYYTENTLSGNNCSWKLGQHAKGYLSNFDVVKGDIKLSIHLD